MHNLNLNNVTVTKALVDSNNQYHCDDGPAITWEDQYDCGCLYYNHGQLHRDDGPAIADTSGHAEFWINGIQVKVVKNNHETNPATL